MGKKKEEKRRRNISMHVGPCDVQHEVGIKVSSIFAVAVFQQHIQFDSHFRMAISDHDDKRSFRLHFFPSVSQNRCGARCRSSLCQRILLVFAFARSFQWLYALHVVSTSIYGFYIEKKKMHVSKTYSYANTQFLAAVSARSHSTSLRQPEKQKGKKIDKK